MPLAPRHLKSIEIVCDRLVEARKEAGMSRRELSEASGVDLGHLSRLETNDLMRVLVPTFDRLVAALDLDADGVRELVTRENPEATPRALRESVAHAHIEAVVATLPPLTDAQYRQLRKVFTSILTRTTQTRKAG